MWKIANISGHHINTFQKLNYDIKQDVATVVFGENKDNPGQERNGSGKSSLLEAISFAITGEPLRDVKSSEEIINDMYDDADVCLMLVSENGENSFEIKRSIERGHAQSIQTFLDGKEIVQPTVLDYNKFILSTIGLTKDDIYGNFILSRNRYKSFFKASDREKKEIINRFSNGVMVDQALDLLEQDINEAKENKTQADLALSRVNGSILALQNEIEDAKNNAEDKKKSKQEKIDSIKAKIADHRATIRNKEKEVEDNNDKKEKLSKLHDYCNSLEQGSDDIESCCRKVAERFEPLDLQPLQDWNAILKGEKQKIADLDAKLHSLVTDQETANKAKDKASKAYTEAEKEYKELLQNNEKQVELDKVKADKIKAQQQEFESKIASLEAHLDEKEKTLKDLKKELSEIEVKLAGKITCPKCKHEFLLGDRSLESYQHDKESNLADQKDMERLLDNETKQYNKACDESDSLVHDLEVLRKGFKDRKALAEESCDFVKKCSRELEDAVDKCKSIDKTIKELDDEIAKVNKNIEGIRTEVFDEASNIIDDALDGLDYSNKLKKQDIESSKAAVLTLQDSLKTIEDATEEDSTKALKKSLKKYQEDKVGAEKDVNVATEKYNTLAEQKTHFGEFKTYLANQKINAIAQITNDFLEEIGSDIRVQLDGYTLLKSGKIRDKISVNLTRNGEDCGSFGKLSGGEQARVCLANILAMHRLTNMNCDEGKGLDILIVDEILDASDETGIASYCESLNNLQMTAIVVTQGYVAENYPYQLKVTKENGVSTI